MSTTAVAASAGDEDAPRPTRVNTPAAVVRSAGLPNVLGETVLSVTGKCRLWNSERTDVARELCAHFRDGLDAGVTPDDLAGSFGDPRRAAKLITATRRRMRPWWWRSMRLTLHAAGALVLLLALAYGVLAARFFLVSPNVTRNIAAELNASIRSIPEADRAWPLYIEAKRLLGPTPEFMMDAAGTPERPGDLNWDKLAAWIDEHGAAFEMIRTAAAKPAVGALYRATIEPALGEAMQATNPRYVHDAAGGAEPANPLVMGLMLPHVAEMRRSAIWLRADARLAAQRNDGPRFLADVSAIMGIANQALREKFGITQQVGVHITELAGTLVLEHAASPGLLSDDDLRNLAHRLSSVGGERMSIDMSTETLTVEDILQRFFSDDGHGDGRFVGGGDQTEQLMADFGVARPKAMPLIRAYQPLQSVLLPSRSVIMDKARRVAAVAAADDALPPWRHDERTADGLNLDLMQSGIFAAAPYLESLYGGADAQGIYASMMKDRDIARARRDAGVTVVAIESYRRGHGAWPVSLDALVPAYLPRVPLDPFDGKPLRYVAPTSEGDRPLLYSIGVDGKDEGGKVTTTEAGRYGVRNLAWLGAFRGRTPITPEIQHAMDTVRGDWVLWPVPESPDKYERK